MLGRSTKVATGERVDIMKRLVDGGAKYGLVDDHGMTLLC